MSLSSPNSEPGSATKEKKTKNPGWSPKEHEALFQSLKELRDFEKTNNITSPLRDIKLWTTMSDKLKHQDIVRTPNGCRLYWGRYGRIEAQFDERADPNPEMLATSVQRTKANTPTKNRQKIAAELWKSPPITPSRLIISPITPINSTPSATPPTGTKTNDDQDCVMIDSPSPPTPTKARTKRLRIIQPKTTQNTLESELKRTRAAKAALAFVSPLAPNTMLPRTRRLPTVGEVRARAALVNWLPEQLEALEEESVRAKGRIPCEERYSWLSQKLGWEVNYQDIKDWFWVNSHELEARNRPENTPEEDEWGYKDPDYNRYYPVYSGTALPKLPPKKPVKEDTVMEEAPGFSDHSNDLGISNLPNQTL